MNFAKKDLQRRRADTPLQVLLHLLVVENKYVCEGFQSPLPC